LDTQTSEVMMSDRARLIEDALRQQLEAVHVEIVDDSAAHADHLGAQGGGGHFRVAVVSPRFEGLTKVAAQRLVYGALGDLMRTEIHAVQMQTFTPEAWEDVRRET
jgi:BolA protein